MAVNDNSGFSRRLRLGLVGGGRGLIGRVHANGARLSDRWDLVAGALSSNPDSAADLAAEWFLDPDRSYPDYNQMAQKESARADGIDAVAIVTPNALHAPVAKAFMAQGIHVISEKPLTAHLEEIDDLIQMQSETGLIYGVTYPYSAHAMVRQARAMVAAGMLGDIRQVHVEYFQDWAIDVTDAGGDVPWRFNQDMNGPSLTLADIGTHAEHMARFVSGLEVEAIRADLHVTGAAKSMEDTAFVHMRLTGGVPGTLMISQAMAGTQCGLRIRVAGTKASLDWNAEAPEVLHFLQVGRPAQTLTRGHGSGILPQAERLVRMPRGHPEALTDAWANLYLEFAEAILAMRGTRAPSVDPMCPPMLRDGVSGMYFVDAALRSHQTQGWVELSRT